MLLQNSVIHDPAIWAGLNHPELSLEEADIAVFGIPYDGGVSFRSGTCEAPQELRKITHTLSPTTEDFRDISPLKVKDLGDCVGKDRDEMFAEAEELVFQAVKAGKFFTMLGGDHSVTIPVHRGINRAVDEDFGIIHIDAHFDLCHEMHGDTLSHGSTERRATELSHVGDSDHLYFLGIRSIESDELDFYHSNKVNVLSAAEIDHQGVPAVLEQVVGHMKRFSKVYITLDIGRWWGYAAGEHTDIDVVADVSDGKNRFRLYCECKFRRKEANYRDYEELRSAVDGIGAKGNRSTNIRYVIFSASGFSDSMLEAEEDDPMLILIDIDTMVGRKPAKML